MCCLMDLMVRHQEHTADDCFNQFNSTKQFDMMVDTTKLITLRLLVEVSAFHLFYNALKGILLPTASGHLSDSCSLVLYSVDIANQAHVNTNEYQRTL